MEMKHTVGGDEEFLEQYSPPVRLPFMPPRSDDAADNGTSPPVEISLKKLRRSKEEDDPFLSLVLPQPPAETRSSEVPARRSSPRPAVISLERLRTTEEGDQWFFSLGVAPARNCKRPRAPSSTQEDNHDDFITLSLALPDPSTTLLPNIPRSSRSTLPDLNLSVPSPPMLTPNPAPDSLLSTIPCASSSPHIKHGSCKQSAPPKRSPPTADGQPAPDAVVVPPPFPWSTSRRATAHSFSYLQAHNIFEILNKMECKKCDRSFRLSFNLRERFEHLDEYIRREQVNMRDRAPTLWMNPNLLACRYCKANSARPFIAPRKRNINWLFLLLGELLGCCTLQQLKYFCKHTNNHRTGAKDRLLYLTYIALYRQLVPGEPSS